MQAPVSFRIVDQVHSDQIDDTTGKLTSSWRITFETPSGVKSFIDIPDQFYTPENVHAWVAQKAGLIEQVQSLDGTPPARQQE